MHEDLCGNQQPFASENRKLRAPGTVHQSTETHRAHAQLARVLQVARGQGERALAVRVVFANRQQYWHNVVLKHGADQALHHQRVVVRAKKVGLDLAVRLRGHKPTRPLKRNLTRAPNKQSQQRPLLLVEEIVRASTTVPN